MKLNSQMLMMQWRAAGIQSGDTVLIHSSLRRTLHNSADLSATDALESFLEAVGPSGTLLLPLFNFDFTKGIPFNIATSKSEMGALTEAARCYPGVLRTGHPIYSFAVLGDGANKVNPDNFSGYGQDSPFGFLHRNNGKIAVLDLDDKNSMTFIHYVEECVNAPWREHKKFTAAYTNWDGSSRERTYGLFVRRGEQGVRTEVNPFGGLLWDSGLYEGSRPYEGSGLRTIKAKDYFNLAAEIIVTGKARGLLYEGPEF